MRFLTLEPVLESLCELICELALPRACLGV